jgi:hypothetical protein
MSEKEKRAGFTEDWGSVYGIVQRQSIARDPEGVSAIVIDQDGNEIQIRGYGAKAADLVEAAAERAVPVVLRGNILGSDVDGSRHLSVLIEGPAQFKGVISDVDRSHEGGPPHVSFWIMNEMINRDGKPFQYLTGVHVYGADAETLFGLQDGDRVSVETRDGPDGHIAISPVTVLPASEPGGENDLGM